ADDLDVRLPCVQPRERRERGVLRAVVDEDRLPLLLARVEAWLELAVEAGVAAFLVVHGDDDRDHGAGFVGEVVAMGTRAVGGARRGWGRWGGWGRGGWGRRWGWWGGRRRRRRWRWRWRRRWRRRRWRRRQRRRRWRSPVRGSRLRARGACRDAPSG